MPLLRLGLGAGAGLAVAASVASMWAGYAVEVALLRGLLVFPPVAFAAFFAELVVSTAPPGTRRSGGITAPDESSDGRRPVDLPAEREARAASASRRAA
ncbi:MAG: hypothetical protein EPO16_05300 [Dehalococcoidia bacterium]|nr:MAG: hypothetical protein EPO16_05300 [Dehalococcoidia bacterium]